MNLYPTLRGVPLAVFAVFASPPSASAAPSEIDRPLLSQGDSWTYLDTREAAPSFFNQKRDEVSVTRITGSSIYFSTRPAGSSQPGRERIARQDWGVIRDLNGTEGLVNQPLSFPLIAGKSWDLEYTEQHPNPKHEWEKWMRTYTVVGPEAIDVPAGHFEAIKIEMEGRWTASLAPAQTVMQGAQSTRDGVSSSSRIDRVTRQTASGRLYAAYWYVPEVKRFVKTIEETYDNRGFRTERLTGELESYKVAH